MWDNVFEEDIIDIVNKKANYHFADPQELSNLLAETARDNSQDE